MTAYAEKHHHEWLEKACHNKWKYNRSHMNSEINNLQRCLMPLNNFQRKLSFILRLPVEITVYKGWHVKTQVLGGGPVSANGIHRSMFILHFETCCTVGGCSEQ